MVVTSRGTQDELPFRIGASHHTFFTIILLGARPPSRLAYFYFASMAKLVQGTDLSSRRLWVRIPLGVSPSMRRH